MKMTSLKTIVDEIRIQLLLAYLEVQLCENTKS